MKPDTLTETSEHKAAGFDHADSFRVEAADHVFTFYPRGSDRLEALLNLLDEALETLRIFYYMFQDDEVGTRVRDKLIEACERGVDVHLIIDDFGSDAPKSFFEPLINAGARYSVFASNWGKGYLVRNHQKFVMVDKKHVMTGGSNISNHYYNPPEDNGWCDLGIVIEGKVVDDFSRWFGLLREWTESRGVKLRRVRRLVRDWDPGDGPVQLLLGGPFIRRCHWVYNFKSDMRGAKRLDLVTAYFGPPLSVRRQIGRLARRGYARLVTAGKSDIQASIDIARLFYKRLIRAGAQIYEFQPCKLHMKLIVVDGISYFGSANCDRRSMRINVELMVRVKDDQLADRLREFMGHLQEASVPIDAAWYREHTSFFTRLRWRFFHIFSIADYHLARVAADDD